MASSSVFEMISASLGKSLETIIIPNFVEVAVNVASQFGEEPPSQDSMKVLFEDAFKKALSNPGKKKASKPKSPKTAKKQAEPKVTQPKEPKSPKAKRTPAPKPQWVTLNEMEALLNAEDKKYYCGFVADRGPNKGKFCGTVLTEEHKNCGDLSENGWVPHSPQKEFDEVGQVGHKMRCKKCWAKGKKGCYRKEGSAEKSYPEAFAKASAEINEESLPEIPDVPNDDIIPPVETSENVEEELVEEELVEEELVEEELVEEKSNDGSDDAEDRNSDDELEELEEEDSGDGSDEPSTEDILDGLINDGPAIEGM